MGSQRAYLKGEARDTLADKVREYYDEGHSVRECMAVSQRSYGGTHRLLRHAGTVFRPRGGERWKRDHNPDQ